MHTLWLQIQKEVKSEIRGKSCPLLDKYILKKQSLSEALIAILCDKLEDPFFNRATLLNAFNRLILNNNDFENFIEADLLASFKQDFACKYYYEVLLFSRGYLILQCYRIAHQKYYQGDRFLALWLKDRMTNVFTVDIHPACYIGERVVFDHGIGLVIGETATIGNDVTMYHNVTLGSTGKHNGLRHPIINDNIVIGAGAIILGHITITKNVMPLTCIK